MNEHHLLTRGQNTIGKAGAIRVLLADDHAAVRSTVRTDLEQAGIVVCGEAGDAQGAVETAVREHPEVCLLDVRMPGSGLVAAWEITSRLPGTKVVMLTMSRSEDHMLAALRAGAVGYVLKDIEGARLARQVESFAEGEVVIPAPLAGRLLEQFNLNGKSSRGLRLRKKISVDRLEERERQLLELLRDGSRAADAAEKLGVDAEIVQTDIVAILGKVRYPDRESPAEVDTTR